MTDSLYRLGTPIRSTDSLVRSDGRTDGRTNEDPHSPSADISPFVSHARAYGFGINQIEQEASA